MSTAPSSEITYRRRTMDGTPIEIDAAGDVWRRLFTVTRHRIVRPDVQAELAEAVGLFDDREMPSLVRAAAELSRGGRPVAFWALVERAVLLSARAHTIPADMPPAVVTVTLADYATPDTLAIRAHGCIPAVRPARRVQMEVR